MFSVIIPAYNCEKTIGRVLDSVINQTRFDLIEEIILINDGSNDATDERIKSYINKHQNIPIKYETQDNHGVSYTRNKAIKYATAEWIALIDSDDIWLPQKIERQAAILHKKKDMVFLGSHYPVKYIFRKYTKGLHKLTARELCIRSMPTTPSVVFKRDVGIELGLYDECMEYCEDINFFQRFLLKDSYYILAEKLVDISIEKKYAAQSGLSSNLVKMAKGRNHNTIVLNRLGLISTPYMILMLAFNQCKFIKRYLQNKVSFFMVKRKKK